MFMQIQAANFGMGLIPYLDIFVAVLSPVRSAHAPCSFGEGPIESIHSLAQTIAE